LRLLVPGGVYHLTARRVARAPIVLDDEDRFLFVEQLAPNSHVEETARRQWEPVPPSLDELFGRQRRSAVAIAYREHGYTLRQFPDHLRVHYSTISRRLRAPETSDGTATHAE
jgi:hypothetical protein